MMFTNGIYALGLLATLAGEINTAAAHSGEAPVSWKRDQHAARDSLEKRCGNILDARRRRRSFMVEESALEKRGKGKRSFSAGREGYVSRRGSEASNDSTVLFQREGVVPESTQGPYHILDEIVRQNITESQSGVPLDIIINFFDIETCKPVQVWVDGWSCNATGHYAGYANETGLPGGFPGPGSGPGGASSGSAGPTGSTSSAVTSTSLGPYSGADDPAAAAFLNVPTSDNLTFLRGVWQTDEQGVVKMSTIVPGWYTGRAVHFHTKVYPQGHIAQNGTFVGDASAVHTGQIFFRNELMEQIAELPSYKDNIISWENSTKPEDDMWYPYQSATGYNAFLDTVQVDSSDLQAGLVGHIAVGLNLTFESAELSTQYAGFDVDDYLASSLLPGYGGSTSAASLGPVVTSD